MDNGGPTSPVILWPRFRIVYGTAMDADIKNEDEEVEVFPAELPLDAATVAWLARLERLTGDHPNLMIASMLRAIRESDEREHAQERDCPAPRPLRRLN